MKFFLLNSLFLSFFVFAIVSCNQAPSRTVTEMEFNVDTSLVTLPVSDSSLGISYRAPGGWTDIEATEEALKQVHDGKIRVSKLIRNPSGNVVFSLTDVRDVPDSTFRHMDENYKTVLNPSGAWSDIQKAEFNHAGFNVKQYVLSRQGQTFFKMLFGNTSRPSFQVDYSIMIDSSYALNTKTLESIIGSLHRDH
ncbi:MAG: hypothetical protein JNK79_08490 [Chitinophagaceae bacterium]|nr:hypothetical protein [Chitinophagaceae bacterium]